MNIKECAGLLTEAQAELDDILLSIRMIDGRISEAMAALIEKPEGWESRDGEDFEPGVGPWDCEESPLGVCVYDRNGWNGRDECIYCGNPEERK